MTAESGLEMTLDEMRAAAEQIKHDSLPAIKSCKNLSQLEQLRLDILGKKGKLTDLLKSMRHLPTGQRPEFGQIVNKVRDGIHDALVSQWDSLADRQLRSKLSKEKVDVTLPGLARTPGARHPISRVIEQISDIFYGLGFAVELGPEIESDYHNFEALNFPKDHPARDMQDTFYIQDHWVLRTHTSPVQIRTMLERKPPLRLIAPGAVYRKDSDLTHSPMFHQIECLAIDKDISMAELNGVLNRFAQELFGKKTPIRFRPSFFPFTEPSAEVDIGCPICRQKDAGQCRVCSGTGWLEILGAGMIDPAVLREVDIDPEIYQGFAFGMGMERIAMILYGINDIRLFFEGHHKFLGQFV